MKKLLLTGAILLSVLAVKADNWCVLCLKGQNIKAVKKETPKTLPAPISEVPNKPEEHKDPKSNELHTLLKTASCEFKLGTRTMKEEVSFPISENGESISYTLDANDEIVLSSRKDKEAISRTWKIQVNDKSFDITIDDVISILKASEEK